MQTLTRWLHANDPTRMVAVDVWGDHPPRHPGTLYDGADAIAETDYSGWYDSPHDSPRQLSTLMRNRLAAMQQAFPGKVLVISEFGAESNGLNPSGSPGSYELSSHGCSRSTSPSTRPIRTSAGCSSGCSATTLSAPPSRAARSTTCCPGYA